MKKILIYNSGGGLGDSIQLFPIIISLKNHFKRSKFYYLGAHANHFRGKLKEYKIDLETVDLDKNKYSNLFINYQNKEILPVKKSQADVKNIIKYAELKYLSKFNFFE